MALFTVWASRFDRFMWTCFVISPSFTFSATNEIFEFLYVFMGFSAWCSCSVSFHRRQKFHFLQFFNAICCHFDKSRQSGFSRLKNRDDFVKMLKFILKFGYMGSYVYFILLHLGTGRSPDSLRDISLNVVPPECFFSPVNGSQSFSLEVRIYF